MVGPPPAECRVCGVPLRWALLEPLHLASPLGAGLDLPAMDWELGVPLLSLNGQMGNLKRGLFQGHLVSWAQSPGSTQVFLVLGLVTFPWPSLV